MVGRLLQSSHRIREIARHKLALPEDIKPVRTGGKPLNRSFLDLEEVAFMPDRR